jgi:tetratricopeptide (TPR) repeat protein
MRTLQSLHAAARERPHDDMIRRALGQAYSDLQQPADALGHFDAARALNPDFAGHWAACAGTLAALGRVDEAIAHYERALLIDPLASHVCAAFGKLLAEHTGETERAESVLTRSLLLDERQTDAYITLTHLAASRMSADDAIARVNALLAGRGDPIRVRAGVAWALTKLGQYERARAIFRACLDAVPDSGSLLARLAEVEVCLGDMEQALRTFERTVTVAPTSGSFFMSYVQHLIRLDRLDEARRACRDRVASGRPFGAVRAVPPDSLHREWLGTPLDRMTVMLRTNTGHGDALQFMRFASVFHDAGARVVVETYPNLVTLFRSMDGVDLVVTPYEATPPIDVDVHPALGALLLEWTWEALASRIPYVHPSAARRDAWQRRLGEKAGFTIGVNWQGAALWQQDPHRCRAVPLAQLGSIARVPGVTLHALQFGAGSDAAARAPFAIATLGVGDFDDTAAAVDALDAIVTVDSAMAHLAGALGKPCFVLLPYRACWRWMLDRDTSPMYPSLHLYRQSRPGDWSDVVDAIARDVEVLAVTRAAPLVRASITTV